MTTTSDNHNQSSQCPWLEFRT